MAVGWWKKRVRPEKMEESRYFDRYVSSAPCWQNAVDAVAGWSTAFLPHYSQCYDLIVACGVLYHLTDSPRLIDLAAKRADALQH